MDTSAVPYLLVHREVKFSEFDSRVVFVCFCLLDHMCIGMGSTRLEAIAGMVDAIDKKYPSEPEPSAEISTEIKKLEEGFDLGSLE